MLARNCDLCWLASSSWRLAPWSSLNSLAFSMAITAWSAKVCKSAYCLSLDHSPGSGGKHGDHADRAVVAHQRHGARRSGTRTGVRCFEA